MNIILSGQTKEYPLAWLSYGLLIIILKFSKAFVSPSLVLSENVPYYRPIIPLLQTEGSIFSSLIRYFHLHLTSS